jgi:molybdopterin converting factor subunit 1
MKVLLFARARDLIGADHLVLARPESATVGDLRQRLMLDHPQLVGLLAISAFAVNQELAGDDQTIPQGAEVALLPPVSGG